MSFGLYQAQAPALNQTVVVEYFCRHPTSDRPAYQGLRVAHPFLPSLISEQLGPGKVCFRSLADLFRIGGQ